MALPKNATDKAHAKAKQTSASAQERSDRRSSKGDTGPSSNKAAKQPPQLHATAGAKRMALLASPVPPAALTSLPSANQGKAASETSGTATPTMAACCPQCNTAQSTFYCSTCLSERIIFHHANTRRVGEANRKARHAVDGRLGVGLEQDTNDAGPSRQLGTAVSAPNMLPDPFYDAKEHSGLHNLSRRREALASRASLEATIGVATLRSASSHAARDGKKQQTNRLRQDMEKRRALLHRAQSLVGDAGTEGSAGAVSRQAINDIQSDIVRLESDCEQVCRRLSRARAALAHDAVSLFCVRPPNGTLASVRAANGHGSNTAAVQPSQPRTQRSKERYMPGALSFDFYGAFDLGYKPADKNITRAGEDRDSINMSRTSGHPHPAVNLNDWTIDGLVLPLASDIRRFERDAINGAVAHTVALLQLLSAHLGVALPFVISNSSGVLAIRPNTLWGSGKKVSLYLSSSAYQAATSREKNPSPGTSFGHMGSSMISSLSASTMSTFESFVQLPGGAHLPWSKNVPKTSHNKDGGQAALLAITEDNSGGSQRHQIADEGVLSLTLEFNTAMSMLAYNVAYLAHIEGVPVDLLGAAGSPLRLLSKAVGSGKLGRRAHTTHFADHCVPNLVFAQLDFAQLLQIHEPGVVQVATLKKHTKLSSTTRKQKPASTVPTGPSGLPLTPKPAKTRKAISDIDGSYVDARSAAASILNLHDERHISAAAQAGPLKKPGGDGTAKAVDEPLRTADASPKNDSKQSPRPSTSAAKRVGQSSRDMRSSLAIERMPGGLPGNPPSTLDFLRTRGQKAAQEACRSTVDGAGMAPHGRPSHRDTGRNFDEGKAGASKFTGERDPAAIKPPAKKRTTEKGEVRRVPKERDRTMHKKPAEESKSVLAAPLGGPRAEIRRSDNSPATESAGGTITFNGKAVRGTSFRDKHQGTGAVEGRHSKSVHDDDEEWAVV